MKIRSKHAWGVAWWFRKVAPVQDGHADDKVLVPMLDELAVAFSKRARQ